MTSLYEFAQILGCGRRGCVCSRAWGGRLTTHCPAHQDRHPSLSVKLAGDRVLWHCHTGCDQRDVTTALQDLGLLETKDPARARRERLGYWSTRRERVVAAVERGELSQEAADWMLHGYQAEQERRRNEWQAVADELMAQCVALQEVQS